MVCALCEQESGWDPWAIRWEPAFFATYVAKLNLTNGTEATGRAMSWGLCQVMGQVARENGFKGKYLSQLCEPEIGIDNGCRVLKGKLASARGDVHTALLRYNGGGNKQYPREVMERMARYA